LVEISAMPFKLSLLLVASNNLNLSVLIFKEIEGFVRFDIFPFIFIEELTPITDH
jgi:hypothetical protein